MVRAATAAMGTRFELVAPGDEAALRAVFEEAIHEIEELHRRYTRFSRDSLLAHINRTAWRQPVRLDRASFQLFQAAREVFLQSRGAFDITVGTGGMQHVLLRDADCTIEITERAVQLDLGAIAKGFAVDRATAILRENGVHNALIHGGTSSVSALGTPPGESGWRVALAHCSGLPSVTLRDATLSVSRPLAQLRDGTAHIVDARNGAPVDSNRYAAVVCPSACLGDAWSTALAVLGERPASMPANWLAHIETIHD